MLSYGIATRLQGHVMMPYLPPVQEVLTLYETFYSALQKSFECEQTLMSAHHTAHRKDHAQEHVRLLALARRTHNRGEGGFEKAVGRIGWAWTCGAISVMCQEQLPLLQPWKFPKKRRHAKNFFRRGRLLKQFVVDVTPFCSTPSR